MHRSGVKSITSGGVVWGLMFLAALFPYSVFHYINFLITVLKIIFCLSNVSNLQKSKPITAVSKDIAATPRTYVLK